MTNILTDGKYFLEMHREPEWYDNPIGEYTKIRDVNDVSVSMDYLTWERKYVSPNNNDYDEPGDLVIDLLESRFNEEELIEVAKESKLIEPDFNSLEENIFDELAFNSDHKSVSDILEKKGCMLLPIFRYEHSLVSYSVQPHGLHQNWDCGQVGFACISLNNPVDYNRLQNLKEEIIDECNRDLEDYSNYLNGAEKDICRIYDREGIIELIETDIGDPIADAYDIGLDNIGDINHNINNFTAHNIKINTDKLEQIPYTLSELQLADNANIYLQEIKAFPNKDRIVNSIKADKSKVGRDKDISLE